MHLVREPVDELPAHHLAFVDPPPLTLDRIDGCDETAVRMTPDHPLVQTLCLVLKGLVELCLHVLPCPVYFRQDIPVAGNHPVHDIAHRPPGLVLARLAVMPPLGDIRPPEIFMEREDPGLERCCPRPGMCCSMAVLQFRRPLEGDLPVYLPEIPDKRGLPGPRLAGDKEIVP